MQRLAGRRQLHAAALAVEQADAIARLQRRTCADRVGWLSAAGAGRERKAAGLGDQVKGAQLGQVHIDKIICRIQTCILDR